MSNEQLVESVDLAIKELNRAKEQLLEAQKTIEWLRQKLNEAQERNRKLDWLLTKAVETL